ncbi:hypothetical protein F0562_015080 [Nyssa sinensis]|uniref:EF-hand domain-containing protein n=1 Tax=Nyssa sinensis TaxID=561372 RepID=A0A5J4ZJ70_9ASTE|nr:hypothetical protein F0562_015080 [Nyssa sinensis]
MSSVSSFSSYSDTESSDDESPKLSYNNPYSVFSPHSHNQEVLALINRMLEDANQQIQLQAKAKSNKVRSPATTKTLIQSSTHPLPEFSAKPSQSLRTSHPDFPKPVYGSDPVYDFEPEENPDPSLGTLESLANRQALADLETQLGFIPSYESTSDPEDDSLPPSKQVDQIENLLNSPTLDILSNPEVKSSQSPMQETLTSSPPPRVENRCGIVWGIGTLDSVTDCQGTAGGEKPWKSLSSNGTTQFKRSLSRKTSSSSFRLRSPSLNSLRLRRIFDLFDKNNDSMITVDELCEALNLLGLEADMSDLEYMVRSYIKPGNNGLSFEDFEAFHRSLNDAFFGLDDVLEEVQEDDKEDDSGCSQEDSDLFGGVQGVRRGWRRVHIGHGAANSTREVRICRRERDGQS